MKILKFSEFGYHPKSCFSAQMSQHDVSYRPTITHRPPPERFNKSGIVTWYSGTVHVAPIFTTRFQTDLLYSLHVDLVRLCSDSGRSRSGSVRSCSSFVRLCSVLSGRVLALSGCVLVLSGRSGRCESASEHSPKSREFTKVSSRTKRILGPARLPDK